MKGSKFQVGDRVALNDKTPQYIDLQRGRPRTVKEILYDATQKCTMYLLGSNGMGACEGESAREGYAAYWFRSYQLRLWNVTGKNGRPRTKRTYRKHQNS